MADLVFWGKLIAEAVQQAAADRLCRPTATYRLQLDRARFSFRQAAGVVAYLDTLGVSHLYASPCLKSNSGDVHGYAVVDYGQLDPRLGSAQDYQALVDALHARNMGQILDVVYNHMSVTPGENAWWTDVLENGPGSPYAPFFDVDWRPVKEELHGKILLPLLGEQYGQVLESGGLSLEFREGAFFVRYGQRALPLDPRTYRTLLAHRFDQFKAGLPADSEEVRELESIATAVEHLPERGEVEPGRVAERQREKEVIKDRLRTLTGRSAAVAEFLRRNVREFNGSPQDPQSYDRLDKLLDAQVYRLAHWEAAADEINYRRFFDINDLAAVCMEDPKVFEESHRFLVDLLVRGDVNGLRIDHIDGLYDPPEYLGRLQWSYLRGLGRAVHRQLAATGRDARGLPAPAADAGELPGWNEVEPMFLQVLATGIGRPAVATIYPFSLAAIEERSRPEGGQPGRPAAVRSPLYVVVEKILGPEEPLPEQWPAAGTTGYDFLNSVNGLFVDRAGLEELGRVYDRFLDQRSDFREMAYQAKRLILRVAMASELQLLAHRLNRISEGHRRFRDFTLNTLRVALREILACFPVYRTYVREGDVPERDRQVVVRAAAQAKRRNPARKPAVFDFIRDVLLLEQPPALDLAHRRERELFVGRFQQVTSPVMAKGVEDTTFYRYCPLVSANEVGGDPARAAATPAEFHRQNLARHAQWPLALLATTTHDTKRSEDVRARINVLAEIPHLWRAAVNRWARLNRLHHREVDGQTAPSRNDEYLFYQTLVGVWPLTPPGEKTLAQLVERLQLYMEKAAREAKVHTGWTNPEPEYEAAVRAFVAAALDGHGKNRFLRDLHRFHDQVVDWGLYGALAQTLLKLTSPGVPDIYQGREVWDFSLVDPDNRRPVDFDCRRDMLAGLQAAAAGGDESLSALARRLGDNPRDPRLKLFVIWRTLQFRRRHADLFQEGDYVPLDIEGARSDHLCALARRQSPASGNGPRTAIVVVPRLVAKLTQDATGSASAGGPKNTGRASGTRAPTGARLWEGTRVLLGDLGSAPLVNLFTGQVVRPEDSRLPAAAALADFPVALLVDGEGSALQPHVL
jgi:(1->4)-alpha-D-glucan 1-alpha-D-glucosylmutase